MARRIYVGSDIKAYGIGKHQQYTSVGAPTERWPDYAPANVREALGKSPGLAHLFVDWADYMALRRASVPNAPPALGVSTTPAGPPIRPSAVFTRSNIR